MEKVTIVRVFRGEQATKYGPKPKVAIKVTDPKYGDKWISSFHTQGTEGWQAGDEVDIIVEKKGEYFNFSLKPNVENIIVDLLERVKALEEWKATL